MSSVEQRAPEWIRFLRADEWGRKLTHAMSPERLNDPETYVHHTAGNPHANWDAVAAMRQLQDFSHKKGYATVAYDVVNHHSNDGTVTIMEGRGAARSAATKDRNEEGEAICLMGYFQPGHSLSAQPTQRELEGLAWGIAWMMEQGWSSPTTQILGHRDNPRHPNATSCPGDFLYGRLPEVRAMVEAIVTPPPPPPIPTLPSGDDDMYHPIAKFRNSDTRYYGVPMQPNVDHRFGLDPAKIPADAKMVALNLAVVPQGQPGWLDVRPDGTPHLETSTINFEAGGAHNGATVIGVKDLHFLVRSSAPVHIIIDVTAYWT